MKTYRVTIAGSGRQLLERAGAAVGFSERLRGLMFRKGLEPGEGLFLPDCRSVHTFFMRFPIDLVYLDRENQVVKVVHAIKPWRLSCCLRARSVLEMAAGRAQAAGLQAGDRLSLGATTPGR